MIFLISLCLALAFAWYGAKFIKKHANFLYTLAAVLSAVLIGVTWGGMVNNLPVFVRTWIWPILSNCALATALFAIVMMMAVLPRGGKAVKTLMPIRAELSILACILTLGHNIAYGKTYFVMLINRPERLEGNLLWAAICSVAMILIMLPLMITSFPAVRKKMKAKSWKKLQRSAYVFYALIYIHVMLLATTFLAVGRTEYLWNVLVYSAVFLTYGILRIRKALSKKHPHAAKKITVVLTIVAVVMVTVICAPSVLPEAATEPSEPIETQLEETGADDGTTVSDETAETEESSGTTASTDAAPTVTYVDGTYFGTGEGYIGTTQVAVIVKDGVISSVIVVSSEDDGSYVEKAKTLIPQVISTQRTDLDAVTGATYSSEAILIAIENALSTAVG